MKYDSMKPETGLGYKTKLHTTYATILTPCKTLEYRCEQYQKAKEKDMQNSLPLQQATPTASPIH